MSRSSLDRLIAERMEPDYPDFDVAEQRYRAFLAREGVAPSDLLYITPSDVALIRGTVFVQSPATSARERARNRYEMAVAKQRGVLIAAFCAVDKAICTYVYEPADDDEAERLMFKNGLKLSVPVPLRTATRVGGVRWWLVKLVEPIMGESDARKRERFK